MPGAPSIEDYSLIGDCRSAALLGTEAHGTWRIAPAGPAVSVRQRYRPGTMVLETTFEHEARALFDQLLSLRNDVGLLAEEYDPRVGRMLGNFPQAFSHVGLMNTALNLNGS